VYRMGKQSKVWGRTGPGRAGVSISRTFAATALKNGDQEGHDADQGQRADDRLQQQRRAEM
jgi:hypothetical protein